MVALEIIIFLRGRAEYHKRRLSLQAGSALKVPNDLLRILVFIIFFITNMSTSFLSLYALNISGNETGLPIPKEVLAAIPISAEVLFGAVFSIMGNVVIKLIGQKKSVILGGVLFTAGLLIRLLLPNIWILTLGNSIMGSGWGILLLIVNTVIAQGDEEEKNQGFAGYSAAALNGVNCGIVFGGFLINWLSYTAIFLFAVVLSLLVVAHVVLYLTKVSYLPKLNSKGKAEESIGLFKFITNKSVLKFFLMIVIPIIACSYFLNYLYPILGSEYGLSENKIGYSFLINGLCVICLSSVLTNYFTKKVKKAYSLVIASLLYSAAFLCVAYMQNVLSLVIVLVLLGLSDSFGLPLQTSYYTDMDAVKKYGYDKSIGIYSLFENIAQAGGSFVFSYVLIIGVKKGLIIVLGIVAILAVIFGITFFLNDVIQKRRNIHLTIVQQELSAGK
jgi:predicted MFS family arabinose efflux permease